MDCPVCILCISNLPKGKTKKFYETFLQNYTTDLDEVEESSDIDQERLQQGHLGPIFPQYGSVFLSFWSKKAAFLSFRLLQEEMPDLRLDILPNINSKTNSPNNFWDSFICSFSEWRQGALSSLNICECEIWRWTGQKGS